MAIYHLSIKIITRGAGKSAVAAAAYRAGETIKNEYDGIVHDYTRKGGIVHTEIILPEHAPAEYSERAILWNAAEKSERYCNAQLAREIEIALPVELTQEQNISLVRRFIKEQFVTAGMCADICIHDTDGTNPHAHIMLTMRPIEKDGRWGQKSRTINGRKINTVDWNDREKTEEWRRAWAVYCNTALRTNGHNAVLDHRSYARQGVEQVPTVHFGVAASRLEKRGIRTDRGDRNREIAITNKEMRQLRARINKLSDWLEEEEANGTPPTISNVLDTISSRTDLSSMTRLRNTVDVVNFAVSNKVSDAEDLDNKLTEMRGKLNITSKKLNDVERRIKTLKEHLYQGGYYKEHRTLRRQYDRLRSAYEEAKKETGLFTEHKAKKALETANDFYEANCTGLALFDAAEKYLREHMQKHFDPKKLPPISKWEKELAGKLAEKDALYRDYYALKDETVKIEKIKRITMESRQSDAPKRKPTRSHNVEK